jgi:hypothetical protein
MEIILNEEKCIGDCAVCYTQLMPRVNHAFTECGHLFCIKCLLTWYERSDTCPMCRENLYVKDEEDNDNDTYDGYTDDSGDDGRFDTIDDYLPEEMEWSGIIEEDDLQVSISENNLSQIRDMRKRIVDLLIFQTYSASLLSEVQYNGEVSTVFITRNNYRSTNNYRETSDDLNHYYEIVLKKKNQPDDDIETHYFGHIIEKKLVNVQQGFYPGGEVIRYTLEYAFIMDIYDPSDEECVIFRRIDILFRDIRRLYTFRPFFG